MEVQAIKTQMLALTSRLDVILQGGLCAPSPPTTVTTTSVPPTTVAPSTTTVLPPPSTTTTVEKPTTTTIKVTTTTVTGPPTTTTTLPVVGCLEGNCSSTNIIGGEQGMWNSTDSPADSCIDARAATFTDTTGGSGSDGAFVLKGGNNLCFNGGHVTGDFPRDQGWDYYHDSSRNHGGGLILTPGAVVENVTIDNVADGLRCQDGVATGWTYRGIQMRDIHDDCIDAHWQCSGVVEDSLFEGCYVLVSARATDKRPRHPDRVITVRNSLFHQKPHKNPHSSESRNPGHGASFKWDSDGNSPGLILENNIFWWEQDSDGKIGLGDGRVRIERCSGNVAVWTGSGSFPGNLGPPGCFTVTTDRSVWDQAVAAWKASHPHALP